MKATVRRTLSSIAGRAEPSTAMDENAGKVAVAMGPASRVMGMVQTRLEKLRAAIAPSGRREATQRSTMTLRVLTPPASTSGMSKAANCRMAGQSMCRTSKRFRKPYLLLVSRMTSGTKLTKAIAVCPSVQAWMPRREENASRHDHDSDIAQQGPHRVRRGSCSRPAGGP